MPDHGALLLSLLRRASPLRGGPPGTTATPPPRAGLAAWRCWPVALLVGLVVVATGLWPSPVASAHDWQLGYSAADDRTPDAAAFEIDPGAVPGLPEAPFFDLPCRLCGPVARGPAATRAPLPTRDRSPPAH